MGIVAGSMHTRDGNSFPFSKLNLAVTTCRHFGAMVTSCAILTNHDLLYCAVSSKAWLSSLGLLPFGSSLHVWRDLSFSVVSLGNTVRAARFVDILSHTDGALLTPSNDIFPISKLTSAPVFRKSVPKNPSVSGKRAHQKCMAKFPSA